MATPTVESTSSDSQESNSTTFSHTLPLGTESGDLLIAVIGIDGIGGDDVSTVTWTASATWTELIELYDAGPPGEVVLAVAYRDATGTDGLVVTVDESANFSGTIYRISGHNTSQAPEISTGAVGDDTAPDPDSLTPTGGSKTYLWIACGASDRVGVYSGAPTNYTNLIEQGSGTGAGSVTVGSARRATTATSEDPGTFTTNTSEQWAAATIAVHPTTAAGGMLDFHDTLLTGGMKDMGGGIQQ